jgi:hypothetical protein
MSGSGVFEDVRVPMSVEVLEAEICRRSANATAAELEWLLLVAEFDVRQGWLGSGCSSCAVWLSQVVGLDARAAREKVRVAHALGRFERFADAMALGVLSYAKVRALTRVATLETEEALLDVALVATSNHVERLCAAMRRCEPDALSRENRAHEGRGVWCRVDDGVLELTVRLPVEAGKALLGAIDVFVSRDDLTISHASRRADAMVAMAEQAVAHADDRPGSGPRFLASIHLDDDVLDDERCQRPGANCAVSAGNGTGYDLGVGVSLATAKRLLCDAVLEGVIEGDGGRVNWVGRGPRVPPLRLRRLILLRDGGCRFPGCDRKGWVDVHHIVHWTSPGGDTVEQNLLCLCRFHHRLVHEGGWSMAGDPRHRGRVEFVRPDGTVLQQPPVIVGDPTTVNGYGRTASHGRCGWLGDSLDVDYTIDVVTNTTQADRRRARGQPVE